MSLLKKLQEKDYVGLKSDCQTKISDILVKKIEAKKSEKLESVRNGK